MTIPSRLIPKYYHSLEFPVNILHEKSDHVAYAAVDQKTLDEMIAAECVTGHGTWRRIRKLRLNRPMEAMIALRLSFPRLPTVPKFIVREQMPGGLVYSHHLSRCTAWGVSMGRV